MDKHNLSQIDMRRWETHRIGERVGLAVIGYITLSVGLPLLWRIITQGTAGVVGMSVGMVQTISLILSFLRYSVSVLLPFYLAYRSLPTVIETKTTTEKWSPPALPVIMAGVGIGSAGSMLSSLLEDLLLGMGIYIKSNELMLYDTMPTSVLAFLGYTILAALVEEVAFRGLLFRMLSGLGMKWAILISALVFSLCHSNLLQIIPAFLSGLFFGWIVAHTKNLGLAIGTHMLYNAVALGINIVTSGLDPSARTLLSYSLGVVFFVFGMVCLWLLFTMRRRKNSAKLRPMPPPHNFFRSPMFVAAVVLLLVRISGDIVL